MFSFAAPLFLAGLAVLAAPILIHLINRRQANPLRFPSIRYIVPSALPRQGRRSLRDIILLLLRLLFITAVVLALAQPRWTDPASLITADGATPPAISILVDASASMQADQAWEQAESLIHQTLEDLPANAPVGLTVFATSNLRQTPPSPGARLTLSGLSPTLSISNPAAALRSALDLLPPGEPARLVLISDFQAGEWSRLDWPALPPDVTLTFLPVHESPPPNAAIMGAQVFNAPGNRLRVIVRLANYSPQPYAGILRIDGLTSEPVTLAPGETRPVVLTVPRSTPRPATLTLQTTDGRDAYEPDNTWHLWLGAPPPLRVGLVVPVSQEPEKADEAAFVAQALQTDVQTGHREFVLTPVDENLRDADGLTPDILYLAGAGAYLEDSQLSLIHDYVSNGGILLTTPSQAASRQQHRLREAGLTPTAYLGQPGRHGRTSTNYRIGGIDSDSTLGRLFDEEAARDLYLASLFQYTQLQPGPETSILLATESGHPLLLEETLGRGTVITFAFGLDTSWSDLPLRNAFLPLLRELLVEAVSAHDPITRLSPTPSLPPSAYLEDSRPVEINVPRSESLFKSTPLSALRSALQGSRPTSSSRRSASTEDGTSLPLWPWFAAAALILYLLESLLATLPPKVKMKEAG